MLGHEIEGENQLLELPTGNQKYRLLLTQKKMVQYLTKLRSVKFRNVVCTVGD